MAIVCRRDIDDFLFADSTVGSFPDRVLLPSCLPEVLNNSGHEQVNVLESTGFIRGILTVFIIYYRILPSM
jgi:hypothetical protein